MTPEENAPTRFGEPRSADATRWWIAIGVLAAIAIGLYVWKVVAVNRAGERLEEAREAWRAETRTALEERTRSMLRLSAEPLGLAVREATMAENYGTVGEYLDRMVRLEGVRGALLAVGDTVRVATDARMEGSALADVVGPEFAAAGEARVAGPEEGAFRALVPITGINERIGTLVLVYEPPGEPEAAPADTTAVGGE